MQISLIHPSRGRPEKSFNTSNDWLNKAGCEVELIVSIDNSDVYQNSYCNIYGVSDFDNQFGVKQNSINGHKILLSKNSSVVEATNAAAKESTGDILIYLSDDFKCPDNWGALVLKEFEGEERPLLVKVDDCLQNFDVPVLTIPIMNRALYAKLGYFWFPEYKSMFCDTDLFETCRRIGVIKNARHLKFPHEHVSIGKAQDDETYRNSARNWDQGKALFAKRKAAGFPV